MKNYKSIIALVAAGLASTALVSQAGIANVTGYVWENTVTPWELIASPVASVPTFGTLPSTAVASGTLAGNGSLNFTSLVGLNPLGNYTISSFLGTGGYSYSAIIAGSGSDTLNNTLFEFTGSTFLTHGQTISVLNDDGIILYIGGTAAGNVVISDPAPTLATGESAIWTGATGTYSFTMLYAEVDGAPGVLNANLTIVPEPSTVVAGALLLLPFGIGAVRSLRKERNA